VGEHCYDHKCRGVNKSFENVAKFKYLKMIEKNRNYRYILAVSGHALLWLLPVKRKRRKREAAHASNTFNVPMPVVKQ
jgi:hypothetical protein